MDSARNIPPTGIRFSRELKQVLKTVAKQEGRSVNREVIKRIERSLKEDGFINA